MTSEYSANALSIAPYFCVGDIHLSVKWHTEKLGFTVDKLWGEPPVFTIAQYGPVSLMLKQSQASADFFGVDPDDAWNACIWVKKLDPVLKKIREGGVPILRGPERTPYNCTEVEVRDPDGYVICSGGNE